MLTLRFNNQSKCDIDAIVERYRKKGLAQVSTYIIGALTTYRITVLPYKEADNAKMA